MMTLKTSTLIQDRECRDVRNNHRRDKPLLLIMVLMRKALHHATVSTRHPFIAANIRLLLLLHLKLNLEGTESEEVMEFGGHSESERVPESCEVMINVDSDDEGEDFSRVQKKRRVTKIIG